MTARVLTLLFLAAIGLPALAGEEDPRDQRIEDLEKVVDELRREVRALQENDLDSMLGADGDVSDLEERIQRIEESPMLDSRNWTQRFTLGGYGEIHYNFGESKSPDIFDIHRFVLFIGYEFSDWVSLNSELEIEHAFVDDGNGELVLEQVFLDFQLSEPANVRAGLFLTPMGIVNQRHEPPSFNGVERPLFDQVIIPTTWSMGGIGLFGALSNEVDYQLYVGTSLDGSKFNATSGIRGGRIKERGSLHSPAVTGRMDWYPFAETEVTMSQVLRFGASGFYGGLDNGNKGVNPDTGGNLQIYSADTDYSIGIFDFRGVFAYELISNAEKLGNGTASAILGWYIEGAVHLFPPSWRKGKLAHSDLVFFVRYDRSDTQYRMPNGVKADPRGDREVTTVGFTYFVQPNLVIKVDYQWWNDATSQGLPNLFNIGFGWQF